MGNATNNVTMVGNVGSDSFNNLKLKTFPKTGNQCVNFTLSTKTFFGGKEYVQWHNMAIWGKSNADPAVLSRAAHFATHVRVGTWLSITGSLDYRNYTDQGGAKHTVAEIRVDDWGFAGFTKKEMGAANAYDPNTPATSVSNSPTITDPKVSVNTVVQPGATADLTDPLIIPQSHTTHVIPPRMLLIRYPNGTEAFITDPKVYNPVNNQGVDNAQYGEVPPGAVTNNTNF